MHDATPSTPRLRSTLMGGISYAFAPMLLSALGVPVMAYIIRRLGPEAYGEWSTAAALVATVTILANLGLRGAFVRTVARDPASAPQETAEQLGLRLALCLVAAAVALIACFALGYSDIVIKCTAIGCAGLLLVTVFTTLSDLLQALQRLHVVAAVSFLSGAILTVVSAVVIWQGGGPVALSAGYLIGPLLGAMLVMVIVQRGHFPVRMSWNPRRGWALFGESRHFTLQQIIGACSANSTLLLLPALVGPVGFGFFAAGGLLATRLAAVPEGLASAFYPALAREYANSPREAGRRLLRLLLLTTAMCIAMAGAITALSAPIANWLFKSEPALCGLVMRITIWSLPLVAIGSMMGYALNAAGKDRIHARLSFHVAWINLVLTAALVVQGGIIAAAWALPLRYLVLIAFFSPSFLPILLNPSREPRAAHPGRELRPGSKHRGLFRTTDSHPSPLRSQSDLTNA